MPALMQKLESNISDYRGAYRQEEDYGGDAGETWYWATSEMNITVAGNRPIAYSAAHTENQMSGRTGYDEEYDPVKNGVCRNVVVNSSGCEYSEAPVAPAMNGSVRGCDMVSHGWDHACVCDGVEAPITTNASGNPRLPCTRSISADGLPSPLEFEIVYYGETGDSLCYFITDGVDPAYALECLNDNITLVPDVQTNAALKNLVCRYDVLKQVYGGGPACECDFDPVQIQDCRNATSIDSDVKAQFIGILSGTTTSAITETDNETGHCYAFMYRYPTAAGYQDLEHVVCFDSSNLITFASWGWVYDENPTGGRATEHDVYNITKIS